MNKHIRTGRTFRMVKEANMLTDNGNRVIILVSNIETKRRVIDMLGEHSFSVEVQPLYMHSVDFEKMAREKFEAYTRAVSWVYGPDRPLRH